MEKGRSFHDADVLATPAHPSLPMQALSPAPLHIVHVIASLQVGGAEMALLRLATASGVVSRPAGAAGVHHTVVSMLPGGVLGERFEAAGIPVVWLDFSRRPVRSFITLCAWMRRHRPDVVNTWMTYGDVVGGLAARLCGIRAVVWGIRQTSIGTMAAPLRLRVMYRVGAALSHRVPRAIVCCAHAARVSHIAFGYNAQDMRVIANGFDTEAIDPQRFDRNEARLLHDFDPDHIVVGHLARFSAVKDHLGFVRAARLALDAEPRLRFMMVGRGVNTGNPLLMETLRELNLLPFVALLGERNDPVRCMRGMDIFCLSSRFEGFPNVLGEAMAMGLACITTDAGDARMLAGSAAVVVPCMDAPALATQMVQMAQAGAPHRALLGRQARERIVTQFSIETMCRHFEAVYGEVVLDTSKS